MEDIPLIVMSHAGPSGLGSEPKSICGKDWKLPSLDWGDRDLSVAISQIQKRRKVDLVVFGHMHNRLKRNLGLRESLKLIAKEQFISTLQWFQDIKLMKMGNY